jgi:hypothetical protein
MDLAEEMGWNDLAPTILAIYEAPANIWTYQAAFDYLRRLDSLPVSVVKGADSTVPLFSGSCGLS